jgi:hypothetical protein
MRWFLSMVVVHASTRKLKDKCQMLKLFSASTRMRVAGHGGRSGLLPLPPEPEQRGVAANEQIRQNDFHGPFATEIIQGNEENSGRGAGCHFPSMNNSAWPKSFSRAAMPVERKAAT